MLFYIVFLKKYQIIFLFFFVWQRVRNPITQQTKQAQAKREDEKFSYILVEKVDSNSAIEPSLSRFEKIFLKKDRFWNYNWNDCFFLRCVEIVVLLDLQENEEDMLYYTLVVLMQQQKLVVDVVENFKNFPF